MKLLCFFPFFKIEIYRSSSNPTVSAKLSFISIRMFQEDVFLPIRLLKGGYCDKEVVLDKYQIY